MGVAFAVLGLFLIIALVFAISLSKNENFLRQRVKELEEKETLDGDIVSVKNVKDLPFKDRVFYPLVKSMSEFMLKITPKQKIEKLKQQLIRAGSPNGMNHIDFIGMQGIFAFVLPLIVFAITVFLTKNFSTVLSSTLMTAISGYVFPNLWLSKKIKTRKNLIQRQLPYAMDLLSISVNAGLAFDGAMMNVVSNLDNEVSEEFKIVLSQMTLGKPRRESLQEMADRTGVEDLALFKASIVQSEKLGTGLGPLLKIQSKSLRYSAKKNAQEKAMKAPVKMLFPTIFFIFPTMFLIILGPAMIFIMKSFSAM